MFQRILLIVLVIAVGGCVTGSVDSPAELARQDGCTFQDAPGYGSGLFFDARLHDRRVSQDELACYLEGFAPSLDVAEQQVRFLELGVGGGCGRSTKSTAVSPARRGGLSGYAFSVAISEHAGSSECSAEAPWSRGEWPASVDIASKNMNPPRYPPRAVANGMEGTVVVLVQVKPDGGVGAVIVERSSGHAELDAAAVEGATRWTYNPGQDPAWSVVRIPVDFKLT